MVVASRVRGLQGQSLGQAVIGLGRGPQRYEDKEIGDLGIEQGHYARPREIQREAKDLAQCLEPEAQARKPAGREGKGC